jgi:hypothetical protein
MSYEGYEEFLCPNGHYFSYDAMYMRDGHDGPLLCPHCQQSPVWTRSVDVTNGVDPEYPESQEGRKSKIGFDDAWHTDHYGNRYATKVQRYAPFTEDWKLFG